MGKININRTEVMTVEAAWNCIINYQ